MVYCTVHRGFAKVATAAACFEGTKGGITLPCQFLDSKQESILQFFGYAHLPEKLQAVSRDFCDLAFAIVDRLPRNPERTVALRKLLESKDAAVRAAIAES